MKRHFVTGGTGFIGSNLVKALLAKGDEVYLLVRPIKNSSPQERALNAFPDYKSRLVVISGDVSEKSLGINGSDLKKLKTDKIDFVWHLAANLAFNQNLKDSKRFKANVIGTQNVVEVVNKWSAVLCHCSTAYVCGDSKIFSEDSLDKGQIFRNGYEQTKFLGEKVVREKAKVPYVIFRPSLVIDKPTLGKASNCTFGYYRYVFMFYLFRQWLFKTLTNGKFSKLFLNVLGARLDKDGKTIIMPSLILPFPQNIDVNMVPLDYVINTFIKVASNKSAYYKTYNLTNPKPRTFIYMMKVLIDDLSIKKVKYIGVTPRLFTLLFNLLYLVIIPWRGYIKSALSYLPYITTSPVFIRKNVNLYNSPPRPLSKDYLNKINNEAITKIFPKIKI
ncbi:MAG: Male sterility domain protein [Parcubacteria group bacterium GW2011_GWA1_38_7]|nr:MAG: Male sterility domain protein [Parcubacteria group bacterium GW2011_GWA1_38_7]